MISTFMTQQNPIGNVLASNPAGYALWAQGLQPMQSSQALRDQSHQPLLAPGQKPVAYRGSGISLEGALKRYWTPLYSTVADVLKTMATAIHRVLQHRFQFLSRIQHAWQMRKNSEL
jgi:hypothetical protein